MATTDRDETKGAAYKESRKRYNGSTRDEIHEMQVKVEEKITKERPHMGLRMERRNGGKMKKGGETAHYRGVEEPTPWNRAAWSQLSPA